ncbi:MAG: hypothetical protein U9P14_00950 [Gemmatimonadota bacterium]|nr:hypothetical protein [Gemmatimonadota bacterium]
MCFESIEIEEGVFFAGKRFPRPKGLPGKTTGKAGMKKVHKHLLCRYPNPRFTRNFFAEKLLPLHGSGEIAVSLGPGPEVSSSRGQASGKMNTVSLLYNIGSYTVIFNLFLGDGRTWNREKNVVTSAANIAQWGRRGGFRKAPSRKGCFGVRAFRKLQLSESPLFFRRNNQADKKRQPALEERVAIFLPSCRLS